MARKLPDEVPLQSYSMGARSGVGLVERDCGLTSQAWLKLLSLSLALPLCISLSLSLYLSLSISLSLSLSLSLSPDAPPWFRNHCLHHPKSTATFCSSCSGVHPCLSHPPSISGGSLSFVLVIPFLRHLRFSLRCRPSAWHSSILVFVSRPLSLSHSLSLSFPLRCYL